MRHRAGRGRGGDAPLHGTGGGVVGARGRAGHDGLRRLGGGGRAAERHVAFGLDCYRRANGTDAGGDGSGSIFLYLRKRGGRSSREKESRGDRARVVIATTRRYVPATGAREARFMVTALMMVASCVRDNGGHKTLADLTVPQPRRSGRQSEPFDWSSKYTSKPPPEWFCGFLPRWCFFPFSASRDDGKRREATKHCHISGHRDGVGAPQARHGDARHASGGLFPARARARRADLVPSRSASRRAGAGWMFEQGGGEIHPRPAEADGALGGTTPARLDLRGAFDGRRERRQG